MTQEQLIALASARFAPGMWVRIPDTAGGFFRACVDQLVVGIFDGISGVGLMVWPVGSLHANAYELSWALEHIQAVA